MGDASINDRTEVKDPTQVESEAACASIEILRETKPEENIPNPGPKTILSAESLNHLKVDKVETVFKTEIDTESSSTVEELSKISSESDQDSKSKETILEKELTETSAEPTKDTKNDVIEHDVRESFEINKVNTSINEKTTVDDSKLNPQKVNVQSASVTIDNRDKTMLRNTSDIFSLRQSKDTASTLFSVTGNPSKKYFKRREISDSSVLPLGAACVEDDPPSDTQRSNKSLVSLANPSNKCKIENVKACVSHTATDRNPLTGMGLTSHDEYKGKCPKKRDGNPVTGLGYDDQVLVPSVTRVPPGGYSKGLW